MYHSHVRVPSYSSFTSEGPVRRRRSRQACKCQDDEKLNASETSTLSERVCVAAKQGCVSCLLNYRGMGIDFNHCFDGAQRFPLHYACMEGRESVIGLLLQSGAMLEVKNAWSATPLYAAAKYGHAEICKCLISIGANVHAQNNYGATPLYIAADRGHTHVVRQMIRSGCDINHMVHFGATPLKAAAKHGHIETVRTLVAHGAEVTCDVLLESLRKGQTRLTKYFLQNTDVVLGTITQFEAKKKRFETHA